MRGHHLVVSYPDPLSNLQEGSGNEIIDLPYNSKFSWHNIFVNFVNILKITKILFAKFKFECGLQVGLYSALAKTMGGPTLNHENLKSDHKIFITKIYFSANLEKFMKFLNHDLFVSDFQLSSVS